jgi:uncharacterized 2Fe-2S/4Fe-4S cluster protein (DUF4445 family)
MTDTFTVEEAGPEDTGKALVLFMPSGQRGYFPVGTPVIEAARSLGVVIGSDCGGRGICGRCQVTPAFGQFAKHGIEARRDNLSEVSAREARYRSKRALGEERRLSCSTLVLGDMVIDVPAETAGAASTVRKSADTRAVTVDPAVRLYAIQVAEPRMDQPSGDLDRVLAALGEQWQIEDVAVDFPILARLQSILRAGGFTITVAIHHDRETGRPTLIDARAGIDETLHGIAVDIGSTTIACHLVDLRTGDTVQSAGTANPQIRFGEDLMSRVSYVMMNPGGKADLTNAVRAAVNALVAEVTGQAGLAPNDVLDAVFVANPIMHHLFLGIDPTELGGAPFALAASQALAVPARDLGLEVHGGARVYMLPAIAGHVGADAAAVALAELGGPIEETVLVVDVGTNAEIILATPTAIAAASSPTGPAFEGAEISSGQRAAPGAIERVRIDPLTLEAHVKVIGSELWSNETGFKDATAATSVTGLCGSGLIEAVGEMFLAGIITADGVIRAELADSSPFVVREGRTASYVVWKGARELRITQADVRAIQLAKSALYAGCRLLMDRMGMARVDRIKFTGAFGNYIDPTYAMVLGLIPDCALDKVQAVGNAAGAGARMALVNRAHRREVEDLVRRIEKVETAIEPRFQEHFVNAMGLPNSVEAFPELARAVVLPAPLIRPVEATAEGCAGGRRRRRRARPEAPQPESA